MAKVKIGPFAAYEKFMEVLAKPGALLGVIDNENRPNIMTIGWCTVGIIWGRTICTVYVRPSRHSYTCLEDIRQFTVNAGGVSAKAVGICGAISGRAKDKFAEAGITAGTAQKVKAPIVEECALHYECNVVHYNDVDPMNLHRRVIDEFYPQGNFHRVYFGEVVACYGDIAKL
jgi:flavin reductase (DIM6/NTAB) family NADH-FMN oxidoreductase RutF